ncbi:NACHT domain-containing protein [Phormidesmis priestleyi]
MAPQNQDIGGNINHSDVELNQAGRDLKQVQGDDRSTTISQTFIQTFPQPGRQWNDRQSRILAKMQDDVLTRLDFTLNDEEVLISLRMKQYGTSLVKASLKLRRKLTTEEQPEQELDLNTAIAQVFYRQDVRKKLLILGAPGAGKTTTLLTLARDLLKGAIENPGTVIPIVFELSTWKAGTIDDWLVAQLQEVFNLSIDEGKAWIDDQILLPLMDGLDELSMEQQQQCIAALNRFASRYPHLVVCCRVQEYGDAGVSLSEVKGQICLEPLSDEQIQQYLQDIQLRSLWQEIQASSDMQKMLQPDEEGNPGILRVPLLLSIAAEAYDGKPFVSRAELYEAYIEKRLHLETRKAEREFRTDQKEQWAYQSFEAEPNWTETRHSLAWLARQLQSQNQVELLIEKMQPSWLFKSQKLAYRAICGALVGLCIGLCIGLIHVLIFNLIWLVVFGLILGLILGVLFALLTDLINIQPVERFRIKLTQIELEELMENLLIGLLLGVGIGLLITAIDGRLYLLTRAILFGAMLGLIHMVVHYLKADTDIQIKKFANQGIRSSLKISARSLIFFTLTLIFGFYFTLNEVFSNLLIMQDETARFNVSFIASILALYIVAGNFSTLGGYACIQHLSLRIILTRTHTIRWDYARFLHYCTERRLLQRIGGRYRFLHRELLDHFADLRV